MAWGGARPNSGPKPRDGLKSVPVVPAKDAKAKHWFSKISLANVGRRKRRDETADLAALFAAAVPPPGVLPASVKPMAMDSVALEQATWAGSILGQVVANGLTFMGYPYLAELAQRPEYRVISDCIATECTRKWIKIKGKSDSKEEQDERDFESGIEPTRADDEAPRPDKQRTADRIKELEDDQDRLEMRDRFTELTALDGYFGRAHLFLDMGVDLDGADGELAKPIGDGRNEMSKGKVEKGSLKRLQVVEPVWTYPQLYNAINPLKKDWYQPTSWYVMGKHVDGSRLLTFVGQPVPDMLKPAYSFGGLSRSQMAKPYVDYWLRNRDSVGQIINAFSCFVLKTDMSTILQDSGTSLGARLDMFNALRDNQGVIALNHDSEDFVNVAAPLGTLDALLAQSQEHMAAVARIPLVKLLGISPKGLNATAEGELRSFYDTINAFQRRFMGSNVERVLNFQQLSLWGEVDPDITYEFEPLWSLDEKAEAEVQKTKAETDKTYIDSGVLHPEEVRQRVANDPASGHDSIDVEDVPDLAEEEEQGLQPGGKVPGGEGGDGGEVGGDAAIPFAEDKSFEESAHPRVQGGEHGGEFTSKGGEGSGGSEIDTGGKSKKQVITDLLKKGTTAANVLKATGWPSVSMPQQAAAAGMKLRKSKVDGKTVYRGIPMSKRELEEHRAKQAEARALKRGNRPPGIRGPRGRDKTTFSLLEFLSDIGGVKPDADIRAVFSEENPFVPGFGRLLRKDGLSLDKAREAAVEAGYLQDAGRLTGELSTSTINDLLDAVDSESRGKKQYRIGNAPAAKGIDPDEERYRMEQALDDSLDELGLKATDVSGSTRDRVVEIMAREGVSDPIVAYEQAVMEEDQRGVDTGENPPRAEPVPGWDTPPTIDTAAAEDLWNDYGFGNTIKSISRGEDVKAGRPDLNGYELTDGDILQARIAAEHLQHLAENGTIDSRLGVYRGVALPKGTDVKAAFAKNKIVDFDALTAVSNDRSVAEKYTDPQFAGEDEAEGVMLNIQRRGGVIGHQTSGDFNEAILPAGAKYRVAGVKKAANGVHEVLLYDNGSLNRGGKK